jgi:ribosome biogenesis GTPase / thiamine phosphate phosphatase
LSSDAPLRVLAQHRGRWLIASGTTTQLVPARARLRDTPPVTGDWVTLDAGGAIAALLPRRGTITRRAPGARTEPQVLAANVDLALVVEPLPEPNQRRAERLVALAGAGGVPAALVLTKADVDPSADPLRLARALGLADGVAVSAPTGEGLLPLRSLLRPGETAVLLGPSGAGKSTLANALLGDDRQATGPVREADGRGRHTTVARELLTLPNGAHLIDTPGIREVGVWDGTGGAFADIDALAAKCRFADCRHEDEPGCAVRDTIDPERLAAARKLEREQAWVDDRRAAARARAELGKSYAKLARRGKGSR